MVDQILLGFEVGSGEEVYVPEKHVVVTGATGDSGKTTTLEAIASRSQKAFLVFLTKPDEKEFGGYIELRPFYSERTDWKYYASIFEASLHEKMKWERSWIIKATHGPVHQPAKSLREFWENIKKLLKDSRQDSQREAAYLNLNEYLKEIVPEIEGYDFARTFPELKQGRIYVMDLKDMSEEVQGMIIASCLEWIQKHERNIDVTIPEAWKFLPQERGSPIKHAAQLFIRQGATKGNRMLLDSQDITGMEKSVLKQVTVWIMGLQMEENEAKKTLKQVPLPASMKPKPHEVQTLVLGQFFVATPSMVKKIFVWPKWAGKEDARRVAKGELDVTELQHKVEKILDFQETHPEEKQGLPEHLLTYYSELERRVEVLEA